MCNELGGLQDYGSYSRISIRAYLRLRYRGEDPATSCSEDEVEVQLQDVGIPTSCRLELCMAGLADLLPEAFSYGIYSLRTGVCAM